ncbi:hypothetical protein HD554DRAFT_2041691 [Boletus coccyginus]|nr:hypothetical protein HD554DRAFT_2041691 [Boletus coccyginus]
MKAVRRRMHCSDDGAHHEPFVVVAVRYIELAKISRRANKPIVFSSRTANNVRTMTPTSIIMPTHFTGSLIPALYAALDSVAGIMHTLLAVLFAYWRVQDSQLSISETPVEFELEVHSQVVKVSIGMLWSTTVAIVLLIIRSPKVSVFLYPPIAMSQMSKQPVDAFGAGDDGGGNLQSRATAVMATGNKNKWTQTCIYGIRGSVKIYVLLNGNGWVIGQPQPLLLLLQTTVVSSNKLVLDRLHDDNLKEPLRRPSPQILF